MKRIASVVSVLVLLLTSCTGPEGPPGFDGVDGGLIVSSAFEIELDFNANTNYEFIEPYGFYIYPSDVTLVYILWETADGQDIWRLLPQNVFFDDNTVLTYNFDFTQDDVRFFLDGSTNLDTLGSEWTQNQVFRVVVVPADNVGRIDYSDINNVMQQLNITTFEKR
ncbi:hypothetical protein [Olleya sp. YS]|uniref:hypothetical protein n=1 Tax=Olleya sp. YS TaxID=3028318 RepID=UPI0024344673|nr:hypothetical protein [Olleya sp. YS]WGD34679.1 hypothetical protein Ollyesu_12920 [Olleya sp. YS]